MVKKIFSHLIIAFFLCNIFICCFAQRTTFSDSNESKVELMNYIQNIFNTKNEVFFSGDFSNFKQYYNLKIKTAQYGLEHEIGRFMYLRDWASERGIKFTEIKSTPILKKFTINGSHLTARVDEEYTFKYVYENDTIADENVFGIALFHHMKFNKIDNQWKLCNDYYLDCFEDALKAYNPNIQNHILPPPKQQLYDFTKLSKPDYELPTEYKKGNYHRKNAIEYADRYCGVTWATNNLKPKYNTKYKNFTGIGGNCTNYVSQCLGDKEGGALRQDNGWYAISNKNGPYECSAAWVNADAFRNFLLYSGKGNLIKKGSFSTLVKSDHNTTYPYITKIQPGDVISYAKKDDIDHNAIVTSLDSHGYPMINSHTVERYHVPFDLGWGDKNIYFHLIHIR